MTPRTHILESISLTKTFHIYYTDDTKNKFTNLPQELQTLFIKKAKHEEFSGKASEILHLEQVSEKGIVHFVVLGLGSEKQGKEQVVRSQTEKAVKLARKCKSAEVVFSCEGIEKQLQHIVEGALFGDYSLDIFKSEEHKKKNPHIQDLYFITSQIDAQLLLDKGVHSAQSNLLARDLVNMPGSHVFPSKLAEHALEIEKKSGGVVSVTILNEEECKKLGMGSFLSVGKGSDQKSVFIVLHYKGKGKKKFALVGKSITFDSGGLSLKPGDFMMDMKTDMAGGAAVLGVFDYLASQKPEITSFSDVYGVLPAAENMISGSATKPGDIVTAMNGKTIEILNTDAEGRLVLADALVYADTVLKADYIIDLATLTGACVVALGNELAGLFTNEADFEKKFGICAKGAGDEYWPMPLHPGYSKLIKSSIADLKNIGGGRYGGAITAALFLKEFVKKAKWMHIDIAGPAHDDKTGASGWGVLSVIYFLEHNTNV